MKLKIGAKTVRVGNIVVAKVPRRIQVELISVPIVEVIRRPGPQQKRIRNQCQQPGAFMVKS
jgi:hypothetical protein